MKRERGKSHLLRESEFNMMLLLQSLGFIV